MKRIAAIFLTLSALLLAACASEEPFPTAAPSTQPVSVPESSETTAPSETEPEESTEIFRVAAQRCEPYWNLSGELWAQVIVEVANTGTTPLRLENAPYRISDAEGKIVASDKAISAYPQVIAPGETGYYYVETYLDTLSQEGLTLDFTPAAAPCQTQPARFAAEETTLSDSRYGGLELVGTLRNETEADAVRYCVAALLFDSENELIGLFSDLPEQTIPAGGTQHVELASYMLPDTLKAADVARCEVLAYELLD